mmetsp:Transcript_5456/g.11107  ORF Transcript_5456/g.11107 Transcript_5456/m.11107 type:complete len:264 (+) Transcript_5456:261-1052(+)
MDELEHISEGVVHRRRRNAHDRRLADVADHPLLPQGRMHLLDVSLEDQRELAPTLLRVAWRDDLHVLLANLRVHQALQVGRELERLGSQAVHTCSSKELRAGTESSDAEHWRVREHERLRAGRWHKVMLHLKAVRFPVAPPTSQTTGQVSHPCIRMPLMHEATGNVARARIQVFVGAPAGKVATPIVQLQGNIPDGVGQVETHHAALVLGCTRDAVQLEELACVVLDPAEHDQRKFLPMRLNCSLDVLSAECVLPLAGPQLHQ